MDTEIYHKSEDTRGQPVSNKRTYFTSEELKNDPELRECLENPEDEGDGADIQLLKILHQVKVTKTDIQVNIHEKKKKIEDIATRNLILKELKKITDLLTQ